MTTAATSLLGLALPVTGELAGTWGTTVNDSITSLLDTAVAGTTTLSTDGDVTLSTTTLAANQARQAILLCSGARTALRTITAPAQSKIYTIINATTGGYSVKLVGVGPTTGVTIVAGESALVAWNGSDFIKISNTAGGGTFTDLTVSNSLTLSYGTANGVLYLNGSKVATSGSALTFDGTNFVNTAGYLGTTQAGATSSYYIAKNSVATSGVVFGAHSSGAGYIDVINNNPLFFAVNDTEAMRLTSTGLGIGTSSPAGKLHVAGQTRIQDSANAANYILIGSGANAPRGGNSVMAQTSSMVMGTEGAAPLIFITNATEGMRLDSSGNLGIGVTPSAWSGFKAFDIGTNGSIATDGGGLFLPNNAYDSTGSGGWKYKSASSLPATLYLQSINGEHRFYNSAAGTAPNSISFTQAMTLDASGNLVIGDTSASYRLDVKGSAGNGIAYRDGTVTNYLGTTGANGGLGYLGTLTNHPVAFLINATERARIDSSGNLLVGGTSTSALDGVFGIVVGGSAKSTGGVAIESSTSQWLTYTDSNQAMIFYDARLNAERARIDSSGNLGVGTTSPSSYGLIVAKKDQTADTAIAVSNAGTSNAATSMSFVLNEAGTPQGWFRRYRDGSANTEVGFSDALLFTGNVTGAKAERARIDSSGNLLVGKTSTSVSVSGAVALNTGAVGSSIATGNDTFFVYNTTAAAYRFYVTDAGTVFATNTTISAISDQRFKENVRDLDVGLNAIMALKPRKFDWKEGKGANIKNARGFIAQEFEQVFPDLIDEWKDPAPEGEEPYKSVRQDLIPVLVKAIQEQQALIQQLTARVAQLESN